MGGRHHHVAEQRLLSTAAPVHVVLRKLQGGAVHVQTIYLHHTLTEPCPTPRSPRRQSFPPPAWLLGLRMLNEHLKRRDGIEPSVSADTLPQPFGEIMSASQPPRFGRPLLQLPGEGLPVADATVAGWVCGRPTSHRSHCRSHWCSEEHVPSQPSTHPPTHTEDLWQKSPPS